MHRAARVTFLMAPLLVAALTEAQDNRWYLSASAGQSVLFIGTGDPRKASSLGLAYELGPERRLRWGPHQGNLILEGYYNYSRSPGVGTKWPRNSTQAWGVLAMARYKWTQPNAPTSFIDLGWGFQVASEVTRDLESKLNSTPVLDFGVVLGREHEAMIVAARFLHVSNAGTVGDNSGQNQIYLLIQIPF